MADDLPRLMGTGHHRQRRGALGDALVAGRYGSDSGPPGVALSVLTPALVWLLRGPGVAQAAARNHRDPPVTLPDRVGEPARRVRLDGGTLAYYPTGPRQWTVIGWGVTRSGAHPQVGSDCPDGRYFDVTEGRTLVQLAGLGAERVLTKGCPFDLSLLPAGAGVATVLGELNALVLRGLPDSGTESTRPSSPDMVFTVVFPRTYAVSGYQWLLEASLEFGVVVEEAKVPSGNG